jgi:hypothetical protein
MDVIPNLLFWLHFIGLGMGVGGGIALGITGPKLNSTTGAELELVWNLEAAFSKVASVGVLVLLVTGPLMVEWVGRRHRSGRGNYALMALSGRLAGGGMIAAILCAVFEFN